MRRIYLPLLLTLLLALVACGGSEEPTPTPGSPAEEPAPTTASEDTTGSVLDSMEHTPDPNLTNKTWAWERREPNGNDSATIYVQDPENYTLFFNDDGTFSAKMDCNNGTGSYKTPSEGNIFMELGPMQMAICGDNSLDTSMSQMFGPAQNYRFEQDGNVVAFAWAAAGPIDYFRNIESFDLQPPEAEEASGTVNAPDGVFLRTGPGTNYPSVGAAAQGDSGQIIGVSEDGEWWQFDAPNAPNGNVWAIAEFIDAANTENVPVVTSPSANLGLTGIPWEWVGTTSPAGLAPVGDPSRYIILFNNDGTANIKADCNSVRATYTVDGSNITITPGPSTMAACPPDSQAAQFINQLSSAVIYFIDGGNLYLNLPANSGTMRFVPQGSPPPNPDAPSGGADGITFYLVSFGAQGQEQAVIPGTQITADFADGKVTGSAGCNNYSGTLTPANDYFTVTGIATTRKFCSEPAGIMDQESAYLAALGNITSYQWEQGVVNDVSVVTNGQIFYTTPDGQNGVMNFVSSQ